MMTQFFQVLKPIIAGMITILVFYDDSILSGTKTGFIEDCALTWFYDDSILSGTKTKKKSKKRKK